MVSQTVCYTGVCTYSSTVLLVVFCLHFLQSLICFVQQFLNVLSVLLLHLKLFLLKLSQLVIQLKRVKFICVLNIVVRWNKFECLCGKQSLRLIIKIPALRLEGTVQRIKEGQGETEQANKKERVMVFFFICFFWNPTYFLCLLCSPVFPFEISYHWKNQRCRHQDTSLF